ncbi:hypothetical protein F4694_005841 [Bacillus niacini]|uniref:Uncharacterized protein n=1 Tax=Neobacillus niacini TaxID=86668 RepID=A0A852TPZ6_9BACI|nr:hypothetical protein [Neobacillus niacini]NYE08984.1 hypothetical protein [Neobacillus niacini]
MIDILLAIVSTLAIVLGIGGLIKPKWTLMWGEKTRKKILITYLPICLVTLFLLWTTIETKGKTYKRTSDISQEEMFNKQKESIRVIETELDKLAENYVYYQVTSELLLKQTNWINEKVVPYFENIEGIKNITDKAENLSKLSMVKQVSKVSPIGDLSATISETIIYIKKLREFLELNKEINSSINKIKTLHEEYDKTKDIVVLQEINKELTTNYIYLIGDLEKFTNESIDIFDTFATLIYQKQNIKMFASDAIDVVKIWDNSKEQTSEEENTLEQLEENKKDIENAPEEIQNRMKLDYEYILKIQSETEVISAFNEILSKN